MAGQESSPDSAEMDMRSIIEETSAELKMSEHSQRQIPRKVNKDMKRISEDTDNDNVFNASGLDDEVSDVPAPNTRRDGRSSDFEYTGNSGLVVGVGEGREEMTQWQAAKKRIKQFRRWCGMVVNNERVQYSIVACIFINAAMMGIATYGYVQDNPLAYDVFQMADLVFLIIFTIELLFQAIFNGPKLLLDGWLVFDLIVIIPSWWSVGSNDMANVQVIRAFRIFRAFRLVTRVKIMKDLIIAILSVMPRMIAILLMLLLIFYIFAVMFTQLYSEATYPEGYENAGEPIIYFSNLEQSFLTLFQLMTMDEWANVVRDLQVQYKWSWFFMVIFVVITGLIVVNLIVAVICDAISTLSDPDKARLQGTYDEDSEGTRIELREQIDTIEDQIGDLTRIQARTFHTLQYLTQQLQIEKEKSSELKRASLASEENKGNKDKRSDMMRKTNSAERSRRKGFAQTGFVSKRKNYTDTWTQEGSDKSLRQAMITNFAKSARELQKMRDREESTSQFAKSLRELKIMREEEAQRDEEEKQKEDAKKEQADTQKMNDVLARLKGATMAKSLRDMNVKKEDEAKRKEEEKKRKEAAEKEESDKQT
eukprot:CAMPEP_0116126604 /NCGR_PEP_ID=MMETSP0329-20121206/6417_1 /TAXON_ID=697910 /ORGANISM="Pseudo-nitzschia arenysensis, Strain B593" /LENGTH=593 /DNA_ID=CAMNT_0003620691 /DNA_START=264 /DNA_END=2041 /DNA_ORIENTATION=-